MYCFIYLYLTKKANKKEENLIIIKERYFNKF